MRRGDNALLGAQPLGHLLSRHVSASTKLGAEGILNKLARQGRRARTGGRIGHFHRQLNAQVITRQGATNAHWVAFPAKVITFQGLTRSEERRVGKECRSGWSPYD